MPKPKIRARKSQPFVPGLLICKEKHGDLYFNIPDELTLHAVALDILTKRLKCGNWYYKPEEPEDKSGLTDEQIAALPDGGTKSSALRMKADWKFSLSYFNREFDVFSEIEEAVKKKDGRLAWSMLRERSDGEYERINFEQFDTEYYE